MTTNAKNLVSELLPCPFCGSVAYTENQFGKEYWVQCSSGHSDGIFYETPTEAEDAWNTRAPMLAQAGDAVSEPVACKCDALCQDNGNVCRYTTPPHDDGKVARDAELWAIHMLGPDDVVAAPSKQAAERVAANFNAFYEAHKHERTHDVRVVAEVIEWTHGPVEHAKDVLASFAEYADLLEPFASIKEQRSLSQSTGSSGGEK